MAEHSNPLLRVEDLHTYYGDSYVLQGVSLSVAPGQIVAVLGRNGMGKTTLIRSISGLTPPRRGIVEFDGTQVRGMAPNKIARLGIALVPQGRRIFPSLTVKENLLLPGSVLAGKQAADGEWNLEAVYREFPRLEERSRNMGNQLSGGEQQMLAIGRALMANPRLILMDEPSEGLAPVIIEHIEEIMRRLKAHGFSILLVEQNFALATRLAEYIYVISAGQIAYEGTPQELEKNEDVLSKHLGV